MIIREDSLFKSKVWQTFRIETFSNANNSFQFHILNEHAKKKGAHRGLKDIPSLYYKDIQLDEGGK